MPTRRGARKYPWVLKRHSSPADGPSAFGFGVPVRFAASMPPAAEPGAGGGSPGAGGGRAGAGGGRLGSVDGEPAGGDGAATGDGAGAAGCAAAIGERPAR